MLKPTELDNNITPSLLLTITKWREDPTANPATTLSIFVPTALAYLQRIAVSVYYATIAVAMNAPGGNWVHATMDSV